MYGEKSQFECVQERVRVWQRGAMWEFPASLVHNKHLNNPRLIVVTIIQVGERWEPQAPTRWGPVLLSDSQQDYTTALWDH